MKIVAFVPIKLKNERIKNKNILSLNGKSLCHYVFNTLKHFRNVKSYCFCSDLSIKNFLPGHIEFLKRSSSLDTNQTSPIDLCKAFKNKIDSDAYLMIHTTSPLIKVSSIKKGFDSLKKGYDSAISVSKIQTFMWYKNKPFNYCLKNPPRTQDLEPLYLENCGFYIFKKEVIDRNVRIGKNPCLIETSKIESVDIDNWEDFELASLLLKGMQK